MDVHPVERAVLAAADLLPRGASVLSACSGGSDSVALAAALVRSAHVLGVRVAIGHVDHALRTESHRDAEHVRALAAQLGAPFHLARLEAVDTSALGLEAVAREHRYGALAKLAREAGADRVATAHTRRDQAETVLLRLARGAGPGALAGIRRSRALAPGLFLVRPLLGVSRADTEDYCAVSRLPVLADPHNEDANRTRVRLRQMFPALATALNPRLEEALAGTARVAADEDALLDAQARAALDLARTEDGFRVEVLAALPRALARRALVLAAHDASGPRPERRHVEELLGALGRDFRLDVPGGRVAIVGGMLKFETASLPGSDQIQVVGPGRYTWFGRVLQVGEGALAVDVERAPLPWTLRHRAPGDRLEQASGRRRKVAALWSAARVPRSRREALAVLADARGRVFWAEGVGAGAASQGALKSALRFGFAPEMT
jgi:tRNA(Ile)-lysidine synthase